MALFHEVIKYQTHHLVVFLATVSRLVHTLTNHSTIQKATLGRFTKPKSCGRQAVLVISSVAMTDSCTLQEPQSTNGDEKLICEGVTTACIEKPNGRTYTRDG